MLVRGEVVKGGRKTEISVEEVIGYARFIYDLPSGHFYQARIDGISGFAELTASTESVEGAVRDFLNPDVDAAEKATQIASGGKPKDAAPLPSETTILVLNGNGVEGAADTATYLLEQREYDARPGGNADPEGDGVPNYDYFQTEVVYDPGLTGAEAAARAVAGLFGNAEVVEAGLDTEIDTMLKVIVGQTFHGTIAEAAVDDTPEHQPPSVTRDFDDVVPLLREARKKVAFPLLVPTLRDAGSSLDSEVPLRAYRMKGTTPCGSSTEPASGATGGSRRPPGRTRPCSRARASSAGSAAARTGSTTRRRSCTWSRSRKRGRVLGLEHAAERAHERDDARDRQGPATARGGRMSEPLGVLGAGWVGLVTAACFAELGHDVIVRDVIPERIAELKAGRVPIHEPGLAELLEPNRNRAALHARCRRAVRARADRVRLRGHAADVLGRRRPLGGLAACSTRSRSWKRADDPRR